MNNEKAPSRKTSQRNGKDSQKGGFVLGLIVGLLLGLAVALGVALYITKTPIPFINKVPQRTDAQDAQEAERNKNWDPNAGLAGKGSKSASGVVSGGNVAPTTAAPSPSPAPVATSPAPQPVVAPAPVAAVTAPTPTPVASSAAAKASKADKAAEAKAASEKAAAAALDPNVYFVQAGAFMKSEDAETQRAKLAIQGFSAKVIEREQSGRTVYRVRIGPIDTRDEGEALQHKVEAAGFEANLVRVQR